jgi:hypothetical protein
MATKTASKALKLDRNINTTTNQKKTGFLKRIRPIIDAFTKDSIEFENAQKRVQSFDAFLWNEIRKTFDIQTVEQTEMIRELIADSFQWTVKRKGKGKQDEISNRRQQPNKFSQFFSDIKRAFNNGVVDIDFEYNNSLEDHIIGTNNRTTIYKNILSEFETIGEVRKALRDQLINSKSEEYNHSDQNIKLIKAFLNQAERSKDQKKLKQIDKALNDLRLTFSLAPKSNSKSHTAKNKKSKEK